MHSHFTTLTIERFRSLRRFRVSGLGRVNLITGRNNTGKSSILEALRILACEASPALLADLLHYREEDSSAEEDGIRKTTGDSFRVSSLFSGYPELSDTIGPILLAANGGSRTRNLKLLAGWFIEERDADGSLRLIPALSNSLLASELIPALVIETGSTRQIVPFDSDWRVTRNRRRRGESTDEPRLPCMFVSAYGSERTGYLGSLWDSIALSDRENYVVSALQIIAPEVTAVSMVGGEGARKDRTAIARSSEFPRPVPLRSFGDGLNRLFGIVLSLVNAEGGLLLIDEFENGLHHTTQYDIWRALFRLAKQLDVQIFATSHSWDAVVAFQRAAADDPEDGVLVRLSRQGDNVIPTLFSEEELAVVARESIEVR